MCWNYSTTLLIKSSEYDTDYTYAKHFMIEKIATRILGSFLKTILN